MEKLISVIVPVYQAEKVLPRCINSIINQTYTDLDIILIDDGSRDRSAGLCDEYAEKDKRVKVVHQANGGVSKARNVGLEVAKGSYVLFVDSDDEIQPGFVQSFVDADVDKESTLLFQGCIVKSAKREVLYQCSDKIYEKSNFAKCIANNELYMHGGPTGKLYSMKIIREHSLSFDSRFKNYEDLMFFLDYINYIDKIKFQSDLGYIYHSHESGLHMTLDTFEKEHNLLNSYLGKMSKYVNPNHKDLISAYSLVFYMRVLKSVYLDETILDKKKELIRFCESTRNILKFPFSYMDIKRRIILLFVMFRCYGILDMILRKFVA